jgi:hypothetical protein
MMMWALTNPLFASPDETSHMVRAQGFSRLDFVPPYETDGLPIEQVDCFRFQADVTADCMDLTWGSAGTEIDVPTDGYPPLLHSVAAIPAVFINGVVGAYSMRIALVIVNAVVLAWAGVLALCGGPWRFTGLAVGITPMAIFTASTVNPTGLTVAGAALMVTAGARVLGDDDRSRLSRLAIAIGALLLVGTRRDGLLWLVVLAVIALVRFPIAWPSKARALVRRRISVGMVIGLAVGTVWGVPGVWRFVEARSSAERSTWQATRALRIYLDQLFGVFGWLDSTMGLEAFVLAVIVAGMMVCVALMMSSGRAHVAVVLGLTMLILVPIAFGTVRYPYFQGRYLLPLWVGVMYLVGDGIGAAVRRGDLRSFRPNVMLAIWGCVHIWSIVNNLKRYATGRNGTWHLASQAAWHPPMMSNLVALVLLAASAIVMVVSVRRLLREG